MAATFYIVQPYDWEDGRLRPRRPLAFSDAALARGHAAQIAGKVAGLIAFPRSGSRRDGGYHDGPPFVVLGAIPAETPLSRSSRRGPLAVEEPEMSFRPTAAQCRAARALLGWSQAELARLAHLRRGSINRKENELAVRDRILRPMLTAFENAGVAFVTGGVLLPAAGFAAQSRAARALIRLEQRELAAASGLSVQTVLIAERGEHVAASSEDRIRKALARAGAEFLAVDGAAGARLKGPPKD